MIEKESFVPLQFYFFACILIIDPTALIESKGAIKRRERLLNICYFSDMLKNFIFTIFGKNKL